MTDPASSPPHFSLGGQLLALVARHGSPEERRLVSANRQALLDFLDHPDTRRYTRTGQLDVGLENRLVLKFNLMATQQSSPWGLLNQWAERIPALQAATEVVFRHKLRCHAGIKLSPAGLEYEIYPYETPDGLLRNGLFATSGLGQARLPAAPHCFGCSSTGELSAYAEIKDVDPGELTEALGFALPVSGLKTAALFNSRRNPDGTWRTDKAGIEFLPFPSHLLNTALSHLNLNFAYLLHRGGSRKYGVIGVYGNRQVMYTTLLPRPVRKLQP